jgi:predicted metal-binding protein
MEACGIDVFSTAQKAGFEISIMQNKEQQQSHIGLLLVK